MTPQTWVFFKSEIIARYSGQANGTVLWQRDRLRLKEDHRCGCIIKCGSARKQAGRGSIRVGCDADRREPQSLPGWR